MLKSFAYGLPVPQSLEQKVYNDLVLYGKTNVYPQIIKEVVSNCGIGQSALQIYTDFLIGDGFQDATLNDIEINENGETCYDLLRFVASSIALFNGVSLHFDYNTLMDIVDINLLDFEFVRVGNPEKKETKNKLLVSDNWGGESMFHNRGKISVLDRYLFKETDEERYNKYSKFEDFKGEVIYYGVGCNNSRVYPKSMVDAVLRDMMTWKSMAVFRNKSANNNFVSSKIIEMIGNSETVNIAEKMTDNFRNALGAENAGNLLFLQGGYTDADGNFQSAYKIHDVNIQSYDALFTNTTMQVDNNITRAFGIPSALLSLNAANGLNQNKTELQDAYVVYNNMTNNRRKDITSFFNKFLQKHIAIKTDNFAIKPKQFINFE